MSKLIPFVLILLCIALPGFSSEGVILDDFKVTTERADVYTSTASSLKLESKAPSYHVKIEPHMRGAVMLTLSRYGYTSTFKAPNLAFGVTLEGYKDGKVLTPNLSIDDSNNEVLVEGNFVKFQRIFTAIPIYFSSDVDSIIMKFSNSHGMEVHQYLSIDGMKVVDGERIQTNPLLVDCDKHSIMIGMDGSGSIDKAERKTISRQLMAFFKRPPETLDSNAVCVMEFGRKIHSMNESIDNKEVRKNIKEYKKSKSGKEDLGYTNWAVAFDKAIERQPDIFIFITDRWSNYSETGPTSFGTQYQLLIDKCNELKANGTRLLFITSGLNMNGGNNPTLYSLLNQNNTNEIIGVDLTSNIDLKNVDLISMQGFETFERINLSSLLDCGIINSVAVKE